MREDAQFRVYSLRPEPLAEVDEWLGHYRSLWESRLNALHTEIARGKKRSDEMTEETRVTTHITGTLPSSDGRGVVRMEGCDDTDIDDLWSALTDPPRLAPWVAEVKGDLHLGGAFRATFTSGWAGPGRVDACEPPRRLLVTLTPDARTRRSLRPCSSPTATGRGSWSKSVASPEELPAHGAGWQAHLEDLAAHGAGREPADGTPGGRAHTLIPRADSPLRMTAGAEGEARTSAVGCASVPE